jgi:hypothetical protein
MYSTRCDLTVQTILNFRENAAAVCVTLQPDDSEQNSLFKGAERFSHFAYIVGTRSGRQALSVYRLWRGNNSPVVVKRLPIAAVVPDKPANRRLAIALETQIHIYGLPTIGALNWFILSHAQPVLSRWSFL